MYEYTLISKVDKNIQVISKLITQINWTVNKQNKWKQTQMNTWITCTNGDKLLKLDARRTQTTLTFKFLQANWYLE
jgi:hypothetical protein